MEDERIVPALVSVYKAEVWSHLGFCGNVRPGTVAGKAAAFSRVGGTVAKSAYYTRLWASFFVKLREKIPGCGLRFLGFLYKIWLLVRKI